MYSKNISPNKKRAEVPEQESVRAKREMKRLPEELFAEKVIKEFEDKRKECRVKGKICTEKYMAEQAGISTSTYRGYIKGRSHHIDLITAKMIADMLGCPLYIFIAEAEGVHLEEKDFEKIVKRQMVDRTQI